MHLMEERDIEFPHIVTVRRPSGTYDENGQYVASETDILNGLITDIQLSLKVRTLVSENRTGVSDCALWMMYCVPDAPILRGDRVYDGARVFEVQSVGEWGSHTECVMKEI